MEVIRPEVAILHGCGGRIEKERDKGNFDPQQEAKVKNRCRQNQLTWLVFAT